MIAKILIVEDDFIEANNLKLILKEAGYLVCSIARSVPIALTIIEKENPDMVLLDIFLQDNQTGIDLAKILNEKNLPFVYISANSNKEVLDAAKETRPYGFLVKPFRKKDVLVMLDIAWYLHQHRLKTKYDEKYRTSTFSKPAEGSDFEHIIGKSQKMLNVLDKVKIVGPTETSVLILGESGTGKEVIAKSIHSVSNRKTKPFIVVNCAALPANLIESELFGHEKGAFTGATSKRVGKFEQADTGTIFLDEIGELPLDLQIKFLRVLQEREIEIVGGKTRKVNVRVIAATNRNLEDEVTSGRFRIDLYYRLSIFPILLPPLRERKEDILLLAEYFLKLFANGNSTTVPRISNKASIKLLNYHWPGNIRELQNLMERSLLLTKDSVIDLLDFPSPDKKVKSTTNEQTALKTSKENERDHILAVLKSCNWKIAGPGGAAEVLDLHVSTLNARMKKLGIEKETVYRKDTDS